MPLAARTHSPPAISAIKKGLHRLARSPASATFNVPAKPIEPGYAPTTRFAQNTSVRVEDLIPQAYADLAAPIFAGYARPEVLTTKGNRRGTCLGGRP